MKHLLNCDEIDSLDEIDEGNQLALVWCETHGKYEWHNLPMDFIRHGGSYATDAKPVWSK